MMQQFEYYAEHLTLELFVVLGNFLEEIVSPLPSFIVLVPAGAAAAVQSRSILSLIGLAVLAGCGRIVAAVILYAIAWKSEEKLLSKNRKFFGIRHRDVAKLRKKLGRTPGRDWAILFLMNGTPMFPTAPLSLACGFIKLPFGTFVSATFLGAIVNAFVYLLLGYTGIRTVEQLQHDETTTGLVMLGLVLLVGVIVFIRWRKLRARTAMQNRK